MSFLNIGWASRDVSTRKPVNIPGQFHARISRGVLDPVTATALVLENSGETVCFVSLDTLRITAPLFRRVRELLPALVPGLPPQNVILNATHSHSAPGQEDVMEGTFGRSRSGDFSTSADIASGDAYGAELAGTVAGMIREAWEKRAPGGIAFGYGFATVSHSRRCVYADDVSLRQGAERNSRHGVNGHGVMYGNTDDPMFLGYEAGADPFVNMLFTFDADSNLTGAVMNVPCPAQLSEEMDRLSASFWHETRRNIRKTHGNIFLLPQYSAGGDLSPRILHYKKAQERRFRLKYGRAPAFPEEFERADIAERLAASFDEVFAWARRDICFDAVVRHAVREVRLSRRMITEEEYRTACEGLEELMKQSFVPENGDPEKALETNSVLSQGRTRFEKIIDRWNEQKTDPYFPTEIHAVRVGSAAFATHRFELYMDFWHRILARSPFIQTFVVQLCGTKQGCGSYVATKRGAANRGYSASMFCNQVSPEGGQQLVENLLEMLSGLAQD